jgi:hypothetical protein
MKRRDDRSRIFFPPVQVPETVTVDKKRLCWTVPSDPRPYYEDGRRAYVRPTDRSILAFARLADAASICEYAKRYGLLWANPIDPKRKRETDVPLSDGSVWRPGGECDRLGLTGWEPIDLWLSLTRRLRAVLRINAALKGRSRNPLPTPGEPDDWAVLGGGPPPDTPEDAQFFLLDEVNWWLSIGGVRLQLGILSFSEKRTAWKLEVAYNGLAGGLAYRLLLMVTGESSLYACDGCGIPYVRLKRAPQPGQENFCDDCSDVAQKRATKRYLEGKKSRGKTTRPK